MSKKVLKVHETDFPGTGTALEEIVKFPSQLELIDGIHLTVPMVVVAFDVRLVFVPYKEVSGVTKD